MPCRLVGFLLAAALLRGETILSVGGPAFGATGADAISAAWESTAGYANVQIAALLANGGNPDSVGCAFLTGPVTAETHLALPSGFEAWATLFSGLELPAGSYTLTITSPGPPASYLNWLENFNPVITGEEQLLGYDGIAYYPGLPGYLFTVSGTRETPEPGSATLLALGAGTLLLWEWKKCVCPLFVMYTRPSANRGHAVGSLIRAAGRAGVAAGPDRE